VTAYGFLVNGEPGGRRAGMRRLSTPPRGSGPTGTKEGCGKGSAAPARSFSTTRSSTRASSRSARSTAPSSGRSRAWRPAPSGARASTRCSRRSSTREAPSAESARRGC
jgi:hypothetical protein